MKKSVHIIFESISKVVILLLIVLLCHCKGEDGDIGPQGPAGADGTNGVDGTNGTNGAEGATGTQGPQGEEGPAGPQGPGLNIANGFIKGTIKGTRTDGTPFSEIFEYTIQSENQGFEKINNNLHQLELNRGHFFGDLGNSNITLLIENKGQSTQKVNIGVSTPGLDYNGFFVYLERIVSNSALFKFRTNALFTQSSIFFPIANTYNTTYKFVENGDRFSSAEGMSYSSLLEDGSKINFSYSGPNTYVFSYIIDSKGVKSTVPGIYGDLIYKYDSNIRDYKFYKGITDLSQTIIVPADRQEVTNFNYDPATGQISFDYKVSIEALRSQNTTKHAIEISGSVNAKVYETTIMRVGH